MQVRKQQLKLDMEQQTGSKSGKEYVKAVYCHSAYLTYMQKCSLWGCKESDTTEALQQQQQQHIMRNAGLKEAQAGIKIAGKNISNLRYADDTTLMAESEEELHFLDKPLDESERGE